MNQNNNNIGIYTAPFAKGYKALAMLLIITLVIGSIYWQTGTKCNLLRSLGSIPSRAALRRLIHSMPQHPTRYPFILLGGERQT